MVLEAIKTFFRDRMAAPEPPNDGASTSPHPALQVAACALLLEIAYADDEFTDEERGHLDHAVQRHFGLDATTANQLIAFADEERRRQVDLHQLTRLINEHYTPAQKMVLMETMWGVVFADGEVAQHETHLMRKLSHLLDLKPAFLAEAKKRARRHD